MKKLILLLFLILSANGFLLCQISTSSKSLTILNLENSLEQKREIVNLSSICKSVSYIILETNPNCLIRHIMKVLKDDQLLFILDLDKLLVFDITGKFINQIGTKGRGPGEYGDPFDFCINPVKKEVYVLDISINKILVFDYSGKVIKDHRCIVPYQKIGFVDNANLAGLIPTHIINTTNNSLIETVTGEFKHLFYLMEFPNIKINPRLPVFIYEQLYKYDDVLTFWEYFDYTIYRIPSPDTIIETIRFDLGKFKLPYQKLLTGASREEFDQYLGNSDKYFDLQKIIESRDNFFLSGSLQRHLELYTIDKETLKCQRLEFIPGFQSSGFFNDMDGGLSFWPMGALDKNLLYKVAEISYLVKESKSDRYKGITFKQKRIIDQIDSTMIGNNPWIMIATLKDK
jgi:hypothetical protein